MPAPFELPGYYWVESRQKFFKTERTATAPTGASWAASEVRYRERLDELPGGRKRRRLQTSGGVALGRGRQRDERPLLPPIVRAPVFGRLSVLLERPAAASSSHVAAAAVAYGLCYRGQVDCNLDPGRERTRVTCLYVHDDDGTDDGQQPWPREMGVLYTNCPRPDSRPDLRARYIPRDDRGFIPAVWPTDGPAGRLPHLARPPLEGMDVPDASAICYAASARRLIVTSRRLADSRRIARPPGIDRADGVCMHVTVPSAEARYADSHGYARVFGRGAPDAVYGCAAAPSSASGDVLCVVGAGRGLALVHGEKLRRGTTNAAAAVASSSGRFGPRRAAGLFLSDYQVGTPPADEASASPIVTAVDFLHGHPQLVLAGGRQPHPWIVDLRQHQHRAWHALHGAAAGCSSSPDGQPLGSANAVAHVRSAGGHRVVAARLRDSMLLYDVRCMGTLLSSSSSSSPSSVVLSFDEYRNEARLINTGFDVEPRLNLVAVGDDRNVFSPPASAASAANCGGGVSLFSLLTGQRLATGPDMMQRISQPCIRDTTVRPPLTLPRVAALRFARLPGDSTSSLFVAVASQVQVYSLGEPFGPEDEDGPD